MQKKKVFPGFGLTLFLKSVPLIVAVKHTYTYIKNRLRGKNLHIKCKKIGGNKVRLHFQTKVHITVHAYVLGIITS